MAKSYAIALLADLYGEMLTEKQRELFDLYYNEDLSLSEIAEHSGTSRQAVRDSIKRAERQLLAQEQRLGLADKTARIAACADALRTLAEQLDAADCCDKTQLAAQLIALADTLREEAPDGI